MTALFRRFKPTIAGATEAQIKSDPTLGGRLELMGEGRLVVFYAPFDHVVLSARVVLVGITPGAQQASNALIAARAGIMAGNPDSDTLAAAKTFASFSGPMRTNLVAMLDHIGLPDWIGVQSCASLWAENGALVHFTSALRYPVFIDGTNYSGAPSMTATPMLVSMLHENLAAEAGALPDAVWIPLGPKAADGLREVVRLGRLDPARVLEGLPHPSGANAERIAYFLGCKARADLSVKTDPVGLDRTRERLVRRIGNLGH